MTIYIQHLNSCTAGKDLTELLSAYGITQVSQVRSIMEVRNRTFNTFAYVETDSELNGQRAIEAYNNTIFMGRTISLERAG